ncbi:unnamed protein product, partial [Polarella glacialis]
AGVELKVLTLGAGAIAAAGLAWYLFQMEGSEAPEEKVDVLASVGKQLPADVFYKVTDPQMGIALRREPSTESVRTPHVLVSEEVFEVAELVEGEAGQQFLRLADGRGWAFTLSIGKGRLICEPCTAEAVKEAGGTTLEQVERMLQSNPAIRMQLLGPEHEDLSLVQPEHLLGSV